MSTTHSLHTDGFHLGWDASLEPALSIDSGDRVVFNTVDASGGQITRSSSHEDILKMDPDRVNPLFGPIRVKGAEPGDCIKVHILSLQIDTWGWTGNIPGFGLLADLFPEPRLHHWELDADNLAPALFKPDIRVPLSPFPGILGTCPAHEGKHDAIPPQRTGGNMDCRDLGPGSTLYLPVDVQGGLFSAGDGHAAQGDGEICGTAIETGMKMLLELELIKEAHLNDPMFITPGPVTTHLDHRGYEVTLGIGPDLKTASRDAALAMIDRLTWTRKDLDPCDAYLLLSVCADLRIKEIVDEPNYVVGCYFPRVVFKE